MDQLLSDQQFTAGSGPAVSASSAAPTSGNTLWALAATGRWLSEDPIGFTGEAANLYRYVGIGPRNATDPSGNVFILVHSVNTENDVEASSIDGSSDTRRFPVSRAIQQLSQSNPLRKIILPLRRSDARIRMRLLRLLKRQSRSILFGGTTESAEAVLQA